MNPKELKEKQILDFMEIYNNGCDYTDLEVFISKVRKETAEYILNFVESESGKSGRKEIRNYIKRLTK